MAELFEVDRRVGAVEPELRDAALVALESGRVVYFPRLSFELAEREKAFLDPAIVNQPRRHNGRARVIFNPASGKTRHLTLEGAARADAEAMVRRFAGWARDVVTGLLPAYEPVLEPGPVSFRACPRKAPQGLHVDSYFFVPTQGRRILRLYTNVNPAGRPFVWQLGETFEPFAPRYLSRLRKPVAGSGWLLERLGITNGRRTAYDDTMRQLRKLAKRDIDLQRKAPRTLIEFPSGSTWLAFTDGVLYGAHAGQFAFDQIFHLPVDVMREPARSPLRTLERLLGRRLA